MTRRGISFSPSSVANGCSACSKYNVSTLTTFRRLIGDMAPNGNFSIRLSARLCAAPGRTNKTVPGVGQRYRCRITDANILYARYSEAAFSGGCLAFKFPVTISSQISDMDGPCGFFTPIRSARGLSTIVHNLSAVATDIGRPVRNASTSHAEVELRSLTLTP